MISKLMHKAADIVAKGETAAKFQLAKARLTIEEHRTIKKRTEEMQRNIESREAIERMIAWAAEQDEEAAEFLRGSLRGAGILK